MWELHLRLALSLEAVLSTANGVLYVKLQRKNLKSPRKEGLLETPRVSIYLGVIVIRCLQNFSWSVISLPH